MSWGALGREFPAGQDDPAPLLTLVRHISSAVSNSVLCLVQERRSTERLDQITDGDPFQPDPFSHSVTQVKLLLVLHQQK